MARLKRTHHQLEKAQSKLQKYSELQKQFQLQFNRDRNRSGNYRTSIEIVRCESNYRYKHRGLLHRIVNQKSRITGDKPSVTKTLQSIQPGTIRGHIAKKTVQAVNFAVHKSVGSAVSISLGAETVGIKTAHEGGKTVYRKYVQKYKREALDDYHKGSLKLVGTFADAIKGTYNHLKQKKQFNLEKARYKLKKAEYRLFKADNFKPRLSKEKSLKHTKYLQLKKIRNDFKSFDKDKKSVTKEEKFNRNIRKLRYKKRSRQLKIAVKQEKNRIRQLKTDRTFRKKELKTQRKTASFFRPAPIAFKPLGYSAKQMTDSGWQKAINADDSNDFLKLADKVKRHGVDKVIEEIKPQKLKERNQKKKSKIEDNQKSKQQGLKKQENRLKARQSESVVSKKKIQGEKKNLLAEFLKSLKNMYQDEAKKVLLVMLMPVIILLFALMLLLIMFAGTSENSGFVLGTYSAQDYDLSEAEKYYTKLAWDMNENIKLVGGSSWKTGLRNLGINTSGMKDKPDNFYWGSSSVYNWQPQYDFDTYKLWCFLCAYYYDFDSDDNDDINYWKYNSDTEKLIKEIFDEEYEFVCNYDNTSHWEMRYHFDSKGYYAIDGAGVIGDYGYIDISYPDALPMGNVTSGKRLYYSISNGEVLNAADNYSATGWYLKNQYIDDFDSSGARFDGWYRNGEQCGYGIWKDGVMIIPVPYIIPEENWCSFLKVFDWITDCRLYYSVKQKNSFDKVIEDKMKSMSHSDERIKYYNLLYGTGSGQMYGNHQTLRNIFGSETIQDYSITNGFGYDMQIWNQVHCKINSLHEGIDVVLNENTMLYAPFDCKITKVDSSAHSIILRKDDVEYWYDGNGGTERDTEVYLSNVNIKSGLSEGDTITEGEYFANSTGSKNCDNDVSDNSTCHYVHLKVKIDTDGYGWDFIDPRLVLY